MRERDRVTEEAWTREGSGRRGTVANLVLEAQAQHIFEESRGHYETLDAIHVSQWSSQLSQWHYFSSHSGGAPWRAYGRAMSHLLAHESAIQSPLDFRDHGDSFC